jgi:hypothetical protein
VLPRLRPPARVPVELEQGHGLHREAESLRAVSEFEATPSPCSSFYATGDPAIRSAYDREFVALAFPLALTVVEASFATLGQPPFWAEPRTVRTRNRYERTLFPAS